MTRFFSVALVTLASLACGTHTTVDPNATGVELTIGSPADTPIDQIRLTVSTGGAVTYGPVFLPDVPKAFAATETLVVLVDVALAGQSVHVNVDGYTDGAGVANGSADVTITAKTLNPAIVSLALLSTPSSCGDGSCAANENACTCPQDCGAVCGDGCCSGAEKKSSCPHDCH